MAGLITITAKLSAKTAGDTLVDNNTYIFSHSMTGDQVYQSNPSITTTAGALSLSPVDQTARYHLFIRNQDATNEVLLSFNGGSTWPIVILPGKSMGPITVAASQTLWLDAQVGTCIVEAVAAEI